MKNNTVYLRDYKTAKLYSEKIFPMTTEGKKIFEAQNKEECRKKKYLVSRPDGERYKNGKISSLIPNAFKNAGIKEKNSIIVIRHSRVAEMWNDKKATKEQKQELADRMMHSMAVAYLVYTRKDFDDEKDKIPNTIGKTRIAKKFDGTLYWGNAGEKDADGLYPIFFDDDDFEEFDEKEFKKYSALAKKEKVKIIKKRNRFELISAI